MNNIRNEANIKFKITKHAEQRFLQRNDRQIKPKDISKIIIKLLENSFPIEFSKEHRVKRLLNNGFEDAEYLYNNGWIFVCSKTEPKSVITVERQDDRQFGRDLFKIK